MQALDQVKIDFDSNGLWVLNIALAVVMFGVALGIKVDDFKQLLKTPKLLFNNSSNSLLGPATAFPVQFESSAVRSLLGSPKTRNIFKVAVVIFSHCT